MNAPAPRRPARSQGPLLHPPARLLPLALILLALLLAACSPDAGASAEGARARALATASALAATEAATPAPSPAPAPPARVTIAAVGDLMLARDVERLMHEHGAGYPFERVRALLAGADLRVGNLEGTLTDAGTPLPKRYQFATAPALAPGLRAGGFDVVSLANNHATDFGLEGLARTLRALDEAGVAHVGAGADEAAARGAYIARLDRAGGDLRVAFLGYETIGEVGEVIVAQGGSGGVARASVEAIGADVRAARARAQFVVVMLHSGTEYSHEPSAEQRGLAHAAIDAGASVVIGHHPHVLQPWERYGGGLILYSLGNFVFDLDPSDVPVYGSGPFQSVVAVVTLGAGAPEVEFLPVTIDALENRPRPATPEEAAAIRALLTPLTPLTVAPAAER